MKGVCNFDYMYLRATDQMSTILETSEIHQLWPVHGGPHMEFTCHVSGFDRSIPIVVGQGQDML